MNVANLSAGQKIELNDGRTGTVRFVGTTSFSAGDWVGVELGDNSGKNDGSVQGKRYFECQPGHGIFCRPSGIGQILADTKPKPKPTTNGVAAKGRPSSIQGPANAARRQTLQQDGAGRRSSAVPGTPTPAGRVASGIRSPVKSPTKQLGTNGTSSSATSRTSTPPAAAAGKRPASGVATKSSRPSMAPPATTAGGRRTSTLPPAPGASRRQDPVSATASARAPVSRTVAGGTTSARAGLPPRTGLNQRLAEAKMESEGDGTTDGPEALSPRESTTSEATSHQSADEGQEDEDDTVKLSFAPPPVPPIPPEPGSKPNRQRRPSSPTAASIHSQRTARSGAAANRQIEELEAKVRLLERKRTEDRDLRQNMEKAEQERNQARTVIEKLQNKYRPQAQELEKLKRELADYEKRFNEIEDIQAQHEVELDAVVVDKEYAEEQAYQYKSDLDTLRQKNEELELELEILRDENGELSKEMSPEERTSTGWLQLEKSNERLRQALLGLRDMTQDKETELQEQIVGLEDQVKELDTLKRQYGETREELLRSQADTEDLRSQLEIASGAEDMIERLAEENQSLRDKITDLRAAIEDLESLKELNDELDFNHVETEKQMQEEIDFKDSLLLDRERTAREQQSALDEADYNISRFRELVSQLQSDLQDLEASKQISQTEAASLSSKSKAMMDLNQKLQSSAAKTQVKTIDLELRKLDAEQASEHLAIVQLFLPESFQAERDSVLALLRFKRIHYKASLVQGFVRERIASYGTRGQDEEVFAACDALDKLTWIASMADRLVHSISGCSAEAFAHFGGALHELEVVERALNDFVDALRRDEVKEGEMALRLGRSVEVVTHLSGLHLQKGLADHADDLLMRTSMLQSHMDSATSALTVARNLIEQQLATDADSEYDEEASVSDAALILNRLKTIIELARTAKISSGKTHRALADLESRHLTLEESLTEQFDAVESVSSQIAEYARRSGIVLQELFGEEGRVESFSPSEVANALSLTATNIFSLSSAEAGPYATLASRLRELGSLLGGLSALPTDLDNTIEFERAPAPWVARAEELKRTKLTSLDTEAELARVAENVRERDSLLKQKETELEEQSVRIEMLEARMKDATKRSAQIAELERNVREAKESEARARRELEHARQAAQHDVERAREEVTRFAEARRSSSTGKDLHDNAMGASVRLTVERQQHKIGGLEGAVRYLKEDNSRLRTPARDAPYAVKSRLEWLHEPLVPPKKTAHVAAYREGEKVLQQMLLLAAQPLGVDLTRMPENKLTWRPAKESSRWVVERRNEEWAAWKAWRGSVVRRKVGGGRGIAGAAA